MGPSRSGRGVCRSIIGSPDLFPSPVVSFTSSSTTATTSACLAYQTWRASLLLRHRHHFPTCTVHSACSVASRLLPPACLYCSLSLHFPPLLPCLLFRIQYRHPLLTPQHNTPSVTGSPSRHWQHHVSAIWPCANPQRRPLRPRLRKRQQRRQRLCYRKPLCHNDFTPRPVNGPAELRWSVPRGLRRLSSELRRRPAACRRYQPLRLERLHRRRLWPARQPGRALQEQHSQEKV